MRAVLHVMRVDSFSLLCLVLVILQEAVYIVGSQHDSIGMSTRKLLSFCLIRSNDKPRIGWGCLWLDSPSNFSRVYLGVLQQVSSTDKESRRACSLQSSPQLHNGTSSVLILSYLLDQPTVLASLVVQASSFLLCCSFLDEDCALDN